mmetsp:Transcript_3061/g.4173  ORF Transcript_3061/g.4173 Transcript_3061/m.4173 type:complete len:418 (+) Transcript_3061:63-1316(+)
MRRRAKASQSDDEDQAERSASPDYSSSEDEKASEGAEEQNDEDGHDANNKEEQKESHKKKEEKAKPEDPSYVPKSGRFFMHDDRLDDVKDSDPRDQKKLWTEEEEEGVWLHDKFNEQSGNSDRQRGRRNNNYSKNNKYVKKRDSTYKNKTTSQQQYRRKSEPQTYHEQPKPASEPTESKPTQKAPTTSGQQTDSYHTQQYQPKRSSYRAKQPYNQPTESTTLPSSNREGSKRYSSQRGTPTSSTTASQQQTPPQDYSSTQQYPKQQMRPSKSYVPRNTNPKPVVSTTPVAPAAVPEEYNVISSSTSMQYNYAYNVPQYPPGVYNPYLSNYPYQYPYPYIPSIPSVVQPTDPAIISQGSIQYYSVPYVEDPTKGKKPAATDINGSSQNNSKSQWIPKRSHAIPIKEPPPETNTSKSTQ